MRRFVDVVRKRFELEHVRINVCPLAYAIADLVECSTSVRSQLEI